MSSKSDRHKTATKLIKQADSLEYLIPEDDVYAIQDRSKRIRGHLLRNRLRNLAQEMRNVARFLTKE